MADPAVDRRMIVVVPPEHPALAGHFPGNPLVPGVLLLGLVGELLQRDYGPLRLRGVPQAKFLAPLRPGVDCEIAFPRVTSERADFECSADGRRVARGTFRFARG